MHFNVRMIPALTAALLLGLASAASGQATSNSRMLAGASLATRRGRGSNGTCPRAPAWW